MSDLALIAWVRKALRSNDATCAIPANDYRLTRPSPTATTPSSVRRLVPEQLLLD